MKQILNRQRKYWQRREWKFLSFFWFAALHYGKCQLPMLESMENGEFIKIDMKILVIFRLFYNICCWYVLQLFIFHAKYELVRFCMLNNEFVIFMVTTGFRMNLNFHSVQYIFDIRYSICMEHETHVPIYIKKILAHRWTCILRFWI